MTKQHYKLRKQILKKQEILNAAREALKQEFIGIHQIIDEVLDAVSPWFLFPELQDKPVVINLWGLTGVGKTALVNRLAYHIGFSSKYYHFNLAENNFGDNTIKGKLENIYEKVNAYPVILALDEFQNARTLDENGMELSKSNVGIIWQLLDPGLFQISRHNFHSDELYNLMLKLQYLLANGVKVSAGIVIEKKQYFINQMALKSEYENLLGNKSVADHDKLSFISRDHINTIFASASDLYATPFEIKAKLDRLNGPETIRFLYDIFTHCNSPKTIDCSKALIFVLGNLDEAYTMSSNYNPDLDADEFHEQTSKINVPLIKKALKNRFRNEQIARLGNIHIIYPAFSTDSFRKLIALELSKITAKVQKHHQINLGFHRSVHDIIYKEGVYPTQGTRPLFTTIHNIINARLGTIISELFLKNLDITAISLSADTSSLTAHYMHNERTLHTLSIPHRLSLENLRHDKRDDMQAITAVHESGHAILFVFLLRLLPEAIYSSTTEESIGGFVFTKFKQKYFSRKDILNHLALYLGGYVAEKIVFGAENITTGANEDIELATKFIAKMLKECGMGKLTAAYHANDVHTRLYLHDPNNTINDQIAEYIRSAYQLAEKTLIQQKSLLLKMADYLSDNRRMDKIQIKEMLIRCATDFNEEQLIHDGSHLFYRNHLKNAVMETSRIPRPLKAGDNAHLILNHNQLPHKTTQ